MKILLAAPVFALLLITQSAVMSRVLLLRGSADLVLLGVLAWALQKRVQTAWHWCIIAGLMVSMVTALPFGVPLVSYALATGLALILRQRVWQAPILAMFIATFFGTLVSHGLALSALRAVGNPMPWLEALNLITLPSLLLNLLLSLPAYLIFRDIASWLYPEELEV